MRSFRIWVLVLAVFFGMSLASGTRVMAEEAPVAGAPAASTDKTEQTEKPGKKHQTLFKVNIKSRKLLF